MGIWVDKPKDVDVSGKTSLTLVRERDDILAGGQTYRARYEASYWMEDRVKIHIL